jgi:D-3-phosphoglycerate dehydrogenase
MADQRGVKEEDFRRAAELYLGNAEVFTEVNELEETDLHIIESDGPAGVPIPKGFFDHYEDVEIILGGILCPFSREIMDMFPKLKVIATCRGGIENVDMDAANEKGIMVVNGYGRNAEAVSDFALALMLAELRNVARSHERMLHRPDEWDNIFVNTPYMPHMCESTVGIFGLGYIGKLVARKLTGFGCKIAVYDPFVEDDAIKEMGYIPVDKETLFRESDIITVHARLVEATRGIIGENEIRLMKPTAVFVNTARAGLVDYDALYQALKEKRIGGAGIDVWPEEPLPADSPWRSLDNVTLCSHMAGGVRAARPYAAKLVAQNAVNSMKGIKTPQIITKERLEDPAFVEWAQKALKELGL